MQCWGYLVNPLISTINDSVRGGLLSVSFVSAEIIFVSHFTCVNPSQERKGSEVGN